ncbi:nuclear transport factor 2 family protein [Microvirga rosea]|uniref:nuclear transport factor 2 family protein n=1 Tax=Microvirga rosea TaxID=2715425 RepID=UPI001D09A41B|nr:nuclear transport factor 2 family protein [Microvirga rosea]MCB8821172.1 nuclear transport factor 2 family protein [Microvirga rosea]
MTDTATIADRYIAVWNELDQGRRRQLLTQIWTEDGSYRDPLMAGKGHDQIDTLIAAVHAQFPGFRFSLLGQPDGYGDQIRFSWALGPAGADGIVKGTDFATLEGGRLKAVTGFLDQVPDAVPAS